MLERLNEAMDYVEAHLDGEIDVAHLARIAATSEYHLRRMFSALAAIPLSEYIRRRRLTLAGAEVLAGERPLLEIAVRYGYGSGEAFARAFRAMHGVSPSEARQTGARLNAQSRMSFRPTVEGSSSMQYRIVEKPTVRIVGKKARVPLVHEGLNPAIVEFVKSIGQETIQRIEALSDQEPFGIVTGSDDIEGPPTEGAMLDYWHAVITNSEPPEDMDSLEVPAGSWAVFAGSGEFPLTVQYLWRDIFTQWFPSNPYRSRSGPGLFSSHLSEDGQHADAEIWIPVEHTP